MSERQLPCPQPATRFSSTSGNGQRWRSLQEAQNMPSAKGQMRSACNIAVILSYALTHIFLAPGPGQVHQLPDIRTPTADNFIQVSFDQPVTTDKLTTGSFALPSGSNPRNVSTCAQPDLASSLPFLSTEDSAYSGSGPGPSSFSSPSFNSVPATLTLTADPEITEYDELLPIQNAPLHPHIFLQLPLPYYLPRRHLLRLHLLPPPSWYPRLLDNFSTAHRPIHIAPGLLGRCG